MSATTDHSSLRHARVRAPRLTGRGWLNTGGAEITLDQLRGRVVVLDFWTFCCVNCLHVLDELRPLEREFGDQLVIIGVHSPKFVHEADRDALVAAVDRYEVHHPVLDDPELTTWQSYAARAWPTLSVIDPEGYVVATMAGEGHGPGLASLVRELLTEHADKGTLRPHGDAPYVAPEPAETPLRFPGAVLSLPAGHPSGAAFVVSDTRHHDLVLLAADAETVVSRIGTGTRGFVDGGPRDAQFSEPQGLVALPPEVAATVGYDIVVADSVNHALRGVRLSDGQVSTLAGTGEQLRERPRFEPGTPALQQKMSTPWGLAWFEDQLVVAMAGLHQLWAVQLAADPADDTVALLAGTTSEGLRDDVAADAVLAQPSGMAVDGDRLWFADSETSSLRWLQRSGDQLAVHTAAGQGLFDFGFHDGGSGEALMQHPLGVTVLPDGSVAVADTYNGAIRRWDPATEQLTTLATDLAEPVGAVVEADEVLVVVESAAHRLTRIAIPVGAQRRVEGAAHRTQRPVTDLAAGAIDLRIAFTPPTGQKLDDRFGDPTQLVVSATPPSLLTAGEGRAQGLRRELTLTGADGDEGVLHISVQAAACDGDPVTGEVPEFAACHLYQQDWGIPVRLRSGADAELRLDLRGT